MALTAGQKVSTRGPFRAGKLIWCFNVKKLYVTGSTTTNSLGLQKSREIITYVARFVERVWH